MLLTFRDFEVVPITQRSSSPRLAVSSQFAVPEQVGSLRGHSLAHAQPVEFIRGAQRILDMQPLLSQIAGLSGQTQDVVDLAYFLTTPDAVKKTPMLMLFRAEPFEQAVMGFSAAVLLFEYRLGSIGSRIFSTADTTGRRTIFSRPAMRARIAARAAQALLLQGAQIVHLAFQRPSLSPSFEAIVRQEFSQHSAPGHHWHLVEREIPLYLPLEPTFDLTLARIGQRTRSNLRYYRRRAERELGCVFVPKVWITSKDFVAFNRECTYAVTDKLAAWRHQSFENIQRPLLCGVHDGNGRWLALGGGRRRHREVEIDWQMNRADLPQYSLSTVLRSYLIEREIGFGSLRLYIEGGTPQPIGRSFTEQTVGELTVRRTSLHADLLAGLARLPLAARNYVAQTLRDPELQWHPA